MAERWASCVMLYESPESAASDDPNDIVVLTRVVTIKMPMDLDAYLRQAVQDWADQFGFSGEVLSTPWQEFDDFETAFRSANELFE